ncbi:uncharacterized protein LOC130799351 [Amaranthus tricolor]|uniref:uncharacterized protein LOC130799351 n=1 Tax=Amaranthus tricolor TaxID=29722 RepID=UPI002590A727|nr:uncharacterized protein LOC130799351 [Amaranthus tricolor]
MTEKVRLVRDHLKAAQDRQKSYADLKRRPEEFIVDKQVLLRVSPMRGVVRFGAHGKLSPRFIGPYEISERVASHVLDPESLDLDTSLSYSEQPVRYLDTKVRSTRRKDISMVKVLWSNHEHEATTWETEDSMRAKYLHLFQKWSEWET